MRRLNKKLIQHEEISQNFAQLQGTLENFTQQREDLQAHNLDPSMAVEKKGQGQRSIFYENFHFDICVELEGSASCPT